MFIQYPDVVHIDTTYKVNQFNVLLISVVGTTSLNTIFQIASIFLVGKHEDDYFWALHNLQVMADSWGVLVKVFFTNNEPALMLAIAQCFPKARQLLCVFYINQAVQAKIRKKILGKEEGFYKSFLNNWKLVIAAKTEDE